MKMIRVVKDLPQSFASITSPARDCRDWGTAELVMRELVRDGTPFHVEFVDVDTDRSLLREAFDTLEAIQSTTGSTLLELLDDVDSYTQDLCPKHVDTLLYRIQKHLGDAS